VRKFLKKLGVTAQREIEKAVRDACRERSVERQRTIAGEGGCHLGGIDLKFEIDGDIDTVLRR